MSKGGVGARLLHWSPFYSFLLFLFLVSSSEKKTQGRTKSYLIKDTFQFFCNLKDELREQSRHKWSKKREIGAYIYWAKHRNSGNWSQRIRDQPCLALF